MLERLLVFVEEHSAEAALEILLPKVIPLLDFEIFRFNGKTDLLKKLPARLLGYAKWLPAEWKIVVLIDRDDQDCSELKADLEQMALAAGLTTKSTAGGAQFQVANRIAIEELEAWFFGDWEAVRAAYPRLPATLVQRAAFRDPDAIAGGTWEALEREFSKVGYFTTGLRKIECARTIAHHMEPSRNCSRSFNAFVEAIVAAAAQ